MKKVKRRRKLKSDEDSVGYPCKETLLHEIVDMYLVS
jgi:hypothetical protein